MAPTTVPNDKRAEEKLLDYHDVLLRNADAELFSGPYWLNDQCIAFYFEYLSHEGYKPAPPGPPGVLLVSGAPTFLLMNADHEVAPIVLNPLQFDSRDLVLFAVNDNPDVAAAGGGSHWSLCAYSRCDNALRHYDSYTGVNTQAARRLFAALRPHLPSEASFSEVASCPQQDNAHDCGMHVLAMARVLCNRYAAALDKSKGKMIDGRTIELMLESDFDKEAALASCGVAELRKQAYDLVLAKAAA